MTTPRMVLAGGTGFLGGILSEHFVPKGWEVVVLTRTPRPGRDGRPGRPGSRDVAWDGATVGDWLEAVDGATAWINLAGQSVNCRYNERNRRTLVASRVDPTRVLGEALGRCRRPPAVWLNSSTATTYRHTFGPAWDEDGAIGADPAAKDAFSIEIAKAWEEEFEKAGSKAGGRGPRQIVLRSAMVLGHGRNSVFPTLVRLVRLGLGGAMGGGRQYMSWIHQTDFCRAIEWLIQHETFSGVVNLAAPGPVTNAEWMAMLRAACGRRIGLPAAAWMLEVGAFLMRTETELVIKSRRVVSRRLREGGFDFRFPELRGAMAELLSARGSRGGTTPAAGRPS